MINSILPILVLGFNMFRLLYGPHKSCSTLR